jgi:hypothetical protein
MIDRRNFIRVVNNRWLTIPLKVIDCLPPPSSLVGFVSKHDSLELVVIVELVKLTVGLLIKAHNSQQSN